MRIWTKASMLILVLVSAIVLGCGDNKPETKPATTPPPQAAQQQVQVKATMNATVLQFIDVYNKEVKQRYSDKSVLGKEKPIQSGTVMYDIPDGKGSNLVLNYNPSDNKITAVTFTVQGEPGQKFDRKALNAWAAAVICATSPSISNDDVSEIRGKLLNETPTIKNGISYMGQNTEKGSPFFQIIARAK